MSSSARPPTDPSKAANPSSTQPSEAGKDPQKPAVSLEEDDEFEDFPIDDWTQEETEVPGEDNTHLWEESWDDDDTSEDFSAQLKEELKKVEANKR